MTAWNNAVVPRLPHSTRAYVAANGAATGVLLAAGRALGATWADLGLSPRHLSAGLRAGGPPSVLLAAGWSAAVTLPGVRPLVADARIAGLGTREVAAQVLLRIPLGTVLWEEVAFRGVLPAALRAATSPRAATAANAVLFGLWHVRPTLAALDANGLAGRRAARAAAVLGACGATAATDLLFGRLRRGSGSLLAPALVHLTANGLGTLAAAAAHRLGRPAAAAGRRRGTGL
nr:CPBP family intramembrane glutamic endopeptidase [Geodermatophilus sabuli]